MTTVLCVVRHTIRGRHNPQCTDPECRGCHPATATPGIHACTHHELDTRAAIRDLPALWADLADTRRSPGLTDGGRGTGDPEACPRCDQGLPCDTPHRTGHEALSPARIAARAHIRRTLTAWCRTIHHDLAVDIPPAPPATIRWMSHYVAVNTGRILATRTHAGRLITDLLGTTDPVGHGWQPGLTAYRALLDTRTPTGVRVQCPRCTAWVRLDGDRDIIRCPGILDTGGPCPEWGTIEHWRRLVAGDADQPMTAPELVEWLDRHHRYRTSVDVIYQWSSRGTRHGKLTRVDTTVPGEHQPDACPGTLDAPCAGCLPGPPRFDPVRAAELVMLIRSRRNAG